MGECMSYCEKCRTRIISGNQCTTCGHVNPGPPVASSAQATWSQAAVAGSPGTQSAAGSTSLAPAGFQKSIGGAVTMLVIAIIGFITPWLPYIPGECDYSGDCYSSISGWESREAFSLYEEFSAGPFLVLFGALVVVGLSIAVLVSQGQGKAINRVAVGVPSIVGGLVAVVGASLSYNAWDSILRYEGAAANQGVGLWLGIIAGLGMVVMGILMLAVAKLTGNR